MSSITILVDALCAASANALVVEFVPVSSTGPHIINGNEIILGGGGGQVQFDIMISDWGGSVGYELSFWAVTFDASSLLGANAIPPNPGVDLGYPTPVACETAADCLSGGCGAFEPHFCNDYQPAFQPGLVCLDDSSIPCATSTQCPGIFGICIPNVDWVAASCGPAVATAIPPSGNFVWAVSCGGRFVVDQGIPKLIGSLRIDVPAGVSGTYTLSLKPDRQYTDFHDQSGADIPGITLVSGIINLTNVGATFACCLPDNSCDVLSLGDCLLAGGTPHFSKPVCAGDSDGNGFDDGCEFGACCTPDGDCAEMLRDDCEATVDSVFGGHESVCEGGDGDSDNDGILDACDRCLADTDFDGVCDSEDACPNDPNKSVPGDALGQGPGWCGCGCSDADPDLDGVADCRVCCTLPGGCINNDQCPNDPDKLVGGICGCGVADKGGDEDGDGFLDCIDRCPGINDATATPDCIDTIPTVSEWGIVILTIMLLLLVAGKTYFAPATSSGMWYDANEQNSTRPRPKPTAYPAHPGCTRRGFEVGSCSHAPVNTLAHSDGENHVEE